MQVSRFKVVYIQPSQYDDEGYLYQFWFGLLPSNALSTLRSHTLSLFQSGAFEAGLECIVETYDEVVQRLPIKQLIMEGRRPDTRLVVGLVGVMSSEIPRATHLALQFREAGVPVLMGGVHVSGILKMFESPTPELERLLDAGVTLVQGEADDPDTLASLLKDALSGTLEPIYKMPDCPDLQEVPVPRPDPAYIRRIVARMNILDTSRGCPFDCSFCCTSFLQGRKMRSRRTPAILEVIEANHDLGFRTYYFSDDNLARSPIWEELFDGLIALRGRGKAIRFLMMVDTQSWKIPRFVEKAAAAGCYQAFFGLETVNPDNLLAVGKKQNRVGEYAEMVTFWRRHGILVHVGYIVGLPFDTSESVRRDIRVLRDRVKADEATFVMLAPFPGSRDYFNLIKSGASLDPDLNNYDNCHEIVQHAHFAPGEWRAAFDEAWKIFYDKDNIIDIFLRAPAHRYWNVFWLLWWKRYATPANIHPLMMGLFRRRHRNERRSGYPIEHLGTYTRRRVEDFVSQVRVLAALFIEFQEIWLITRHDGNPQRHRLTELRERWINARRHIIDSDADFSQEAFTADMQAFLQAAGDAFQQLQTSDAFRKHRKVPFIKEILQEIETLRQELDKGLIEPSRMEQFEDFTKKRLIPAYEEMAIPHVARRRRMNSLRTEMFQKIKRGRGWLSLWWKLPLVLMYELFFGIYHGLIIARQRPPLAVEQDLRPVEESPGS